MARVHTSLGSALGYDEAGSGDAMPIVFLHGVGSDKSVWRPQLAHFGAERRAIAFDYPGYGESEPAADEASRDEFAEAIAAGMEALGIARAHICGLSLGGVVALALYDLAPERCASLILADSFAVHPQGGAIYERAIGASADLRGAAEARVDMLLAQPADPALRTEVVETMARIDPTAYRIGADAVWLADQTQRAASVNVPTLVLVGSEDSITPPALSQQLAELIPGARLEVIEGAGHISNAERPAGFNRAIASFIAPLG